MRVYLDHNASSPLRPEAREAMIQAADAAGNPSSAHAEGRRARALIEAAREKVGALAGAAADRIVFTSGATEANVMALSPGWLKHDKAKLFVSAIEHASVLQGGRFAADAIERLPVGGDGVIDLDEARRRLRAHCSGPGSSPFLVSLMLANNETGALQPVAELAAIVHELGGLLHTDAVQAAGRTPLRAARLGVDLASLSAHKIGGPRGCGALVVVNETLHDPTALIRGGGQERGARGGTENLCGIAGFGAAAACAAGEAGGGGMAALRDGLEAELLRISPDVVIFSRHVARTPNVACFAVPGMSAGLTVIAFDLAGVAISAGSACASGKMKRSSVIEAMGAGQGLASASLRVSLGWNTTEADVAWFLQVWRETYERFKARAPAA